VGKTASAKRSAEDIPPQEVAIAIKELLSHQMSMEESDLIREVGKVFSFSRLGTNVELAMKEGLRMAIEKGFVRMEGGRVAIS
jgi:hypothetical protein